MTKKRKPTHQLSDPLDLWLSAEGAIHMEEVPMKDFFDHPEDVDEWVAFFEEFNKPVAPLKPPFSYYGGKRRVAADVWERLGDVDMYIEPFLGLGAVLLARPHQPKLEVANDSNGFITNFWRAVRNVPEKVEYYASAPVSEVELHSRNNWMLQQAPAMQEQLYNDPLKFSPKAAGYWAYAMGLRIGTSGAGQKVHKSDRKS